MPAEIRRPIASILASLLVVAGAADLSSQASPSTPDGLRVLHKLQDALGGATRLAAIRDFEETIRAQAWDARGTDLGDVRKRTRWMRAPNVIRLDQRGPRGTYVLYFDGATGAGWEILPDLTGSDPYKTTGKAIALEGGELEFAKGYLSGYSVTGLPRTSAGISLADPDRPVPAEMRYEEWKAVAGVRFPIHRMNYMSGVKRGEVTSSDIRVNAGLRGRDLAAKPADFAPDLPHP